MVSHMITEEENARELLNRLEALDSGGLSMPEETHELSQICKETVQLSRSAVWQQPGWHLHEMDQLVRRLVARVATLAEPNRGLGLHDAASESALDLARGLVELGARFVHNLSLLGIRTSAWVDLYRGIDGLVREFDCHNNFLTETREYACGAAAVLDMEQRREFSQLMERAFRNVGGFTC